MTIGALTSPVRHHLVEREPEPVALAEAEPADARRQALEGDALARQSSQRCRCGSSGMSSFTVSSVR